MPDGGKRILSPFAGRRKGKAWKTWEKYTPVKTNQNLAETDRGSYYKEERLEKCNDSKVTMMMRVIIIIVNNCYK